LIDARIRAAAAAAGLFAAAAYGLSVSSALLTVSLHGDQLGVAAPRFHFLTGKALDRLHDGLSLAFDAQLSLMAPETAPPLERSVDRFLFSYDVWEEKFAVTRLRDPREKASHLTASDAEAWCLGRMHLDAAHLDRMRLLMVRLEMRAEENEEAAPLLGDPGLNLASLIEIFSRPARSQQQHWQVDSVPFRVRDLER
jgi:hypothetical protein